MGPFLVKERTLGLTEKFFKAYSERKYRLEFGSEDELPEADLDIQRFVLTEQAIISKAELAFQEEKAEREAETTNFAFEDIIAILGREDFDLHNQETHSQCFIS